MGVRGQQTCHGTHLCVFVQQLSPPRYCYLIDLFLTNPSWLFAVILTESSRLHCVLFSEGISHMLLHGLL